MIHRARTILRKFYIKKLLVSLVLFYLLLGVVGFFILPHYLKSYFIDRLSAELDRQVTIDAISINPYALSMEIGPLRITEKDLQHTFIAFDKLYLNAELVSFFKGGPVLSEIRLERPTVHIVRNVDGSYNFSDLITKYASKSADTQKADDTKTSFSLNNIQILNGAIDFIDGPKKTTHSIRELTLQIPFVSTLPYYSETFVEPLLDAVVNNTRVVFKGRTKPFADSLETQIDLKLNGINVPAYLAYLPVKPDFLLSKGTIDADTQLSYIQYRDRKPSLELKGTIDIKDVVLDDQGSKPLLRLAHLKGALADSDIMEQKLHFSKITVDDVAVYALRKRSKSQVVAVASEPSSLKADRRAGNTKQQQQQDSAAVKATVSIDEFALQAGKIIYNDFLKNDKLTVTYEALSMVIRQISINSEKREAILGEVRATGGNLGISRALDRDAAALSQPSTTTSSSADLKPKRFEERPWLVTLSHVGIEKYAVNLEDTVPSSVVRLNVTDIHFDGKNLSTEKNAQGSASLECTINKRGALHMAGPVTFDPLSARLKINVRGFDLTPFRAYAADTYKIVVTNGRVGMNGLVTISSPKDETNVHYQGSMTIAKFSSIDKVNSEDFLRFDSLTFHAMNVRTKPLRVQIKQIALTDFYSRIIINEDGSLNTDGLSGGSSTEPTVDLVSNQQSQDIEIKKVVGDQQSKDMPKDKLAELQTMRTQRLIKIDTVTVQGGTIHFTDRHIKPGYTTRFQEIGGRISGLTSEEEQFADVELRGVQDGAAPIEITGKINPLRENLYVDLKSDFKNMDLSATSPYAGRYLGYTIEKGKLSLAMQYIIVNKKLDAKNTVFIDQLTLGESVESSEATKMPVKLAIALLKNRKGEIEIDLPIEGTTDDPDFRVGKIIWKVILNILVKAATSPFSLLGALFGGGSGDEMSHVDFQYGSAMLTEQEQKKVDKVLTILYERPALRVEIEGYADPINDREGLKQEYLRRKVKVQKLRDLASDSDAVDLASVVVSNEEYPKYLKRAYKAEKFPKPSNFLGIAKDIPVPEMEKLILTHTQVTDTMLRELAVERAQTVYRYMTRMKKVEPERIFLTESKSLTTETKENVRNSRVDFKLK